MMGFFDVADFAAERVVDPIKRPVPPPHWRKKCRTVLLCKKLTGK